MKLRSVYSALMAACILSIAGVAGAQVASSAAIQSLSGKAIADNYIVVYKNAPRGGTTSKSVSAASVAANAKIRQLRSVRALRQEYSRNFTGFAAQMTRAEAQALAKDPNVAFVEQDAIVTINTAQTGATWGLDRIDQRKLPLNSTFNYSASGKGVRAYVVDTGLRATHSELAGRTVAGYNVISSDSADTNDCSGHGTHVAATLAGKTYGVAKGASVVPVRVFNCAGSGSTSTILAGLEWIGAQTHRPAVVNLSLGGSASMSLDNAVQTLVGKGISVVVAAGNETTDACTKSPARAKNAITVAASTANDSRASFSNYGSCVDVFAPGINIISAAIASDTATLTLSGTSMASPHVAGFVANFLEKNPNATPAQVEEFLKSNATPDVMSGINAGSPNLLLYSLLEAETPTTTPPTTPPEPVTPPAVPKMFVSALGTSYVAPWFNKQWVIYSGVKIKKENGEMLANATVTITESSGSLSSSYTCKTDSKGACTTFRTYSRNYGFIDLKVTKIEITGYEYDMSKNAVTQIKVNRPYIPWWWPF